MGHGLFGYTCSTTVKKGSLKGQDVAIKVLAKSKIEFSILGILTLQDYIITMKMMKQEGIRIRASPPAAASTTTGGNTGSKKLKLFVLPRCRTKKIPIEINRTKGSISLLTELGYYTGVDRCAGQVIVVRGDGRAQGCVENTRGRWGSHFSVSINLSLFRRDTLLFAVPLAALLTFYNFLRLTLLDLLLYLPLLSHCRGIVFLK
ncbi:hypothetical protein RJ641_014118 [Dillenia turbinata]|uniref:Uncharacterized protein n=1 Tax=Dillenia turbinata TaxID=194707 RepID=A0AAN8UR55_9MAGN